MFIVPNKYRERKHPLLKSNDSLGNNGFFNLPHPRIIVNTLHVQASDGEGWEHVSVTVTTGNKKASRCPTWEEMCYIKSLFWEEEDCVIQFHPAKSEYISMHPFCLHLWRPTTQIIPIPDSLMVGINMELPEHYKKLLEQ